MPRDPGVQARWPPLKGPYAPGGGRPPDPRPFHSGRRHGGGGHRRATGQSSQGVQFLGTNLLHNPRVSGGATGGPAGGGIP